VGVFGPQDKSFLLILRRPLYQQRRPSISRQDQYSRVSGFARHSIVSALAVGKVISKARASAIAARRVQLNMTQAFQSTSRTKTMRSKAVPGNLKNYSRAAPAVFELNTARSHDWSGADFQCQSLPTAMRWPYHGAELAGRRPSPLRTCYLRAR
jgi:hypothetical protein